LVLPTFFGPPHMCAVCVDFKDRGQGGLFGATRSAYGRKRLFLAVLDPFGSPLVPLDGPPWPAKLFQCITGDVPWLDPPLFHTVPSVWSHQICLWPKKAVFGRFGPFWEPSGTPTWPSLTPKTVPMQHQGYALTCSTLVPHCSTSLEPPDPLLAEKGRFWLFWTLFGSPLAHPHGPPWPEKR